MCNVQTLTTKAMTAAATSHCACMKHNGQARCQEGCGVMLEADMLWLTCIRLCWHCRILQEPSTTQVCARASTSSLFHQQSPARDCATAHPARSCGSLVPENQHITLPQYQHKLHTLELHSVNAFKMCDAALHGIIGSLAGGSILMGAQNSLQQSDCLHQHQLPLFLLAATI